MLRYLLKSVLLCAVGTSVQADKIHTSMAIAKLGDVRYSAPFSHYNYVNPDAPKGGEMSFAVIGTWDNFNRYASRGYPGIGTESLYDALFTTSDDEIGSYYPLIATSVRYPDNFLWAEVTLNPRARFHDGSPVTAEDVAFTFSKFMAEGVASFRVAYKNVTVTASAPLNVRITLANPDKDLLLGLLTLPILSHQFWQHHNLSEPLSTPPPGSSAYRISDWKTGEYIIYSRVPDYWAADLPVNKGRYNFDTLRYDYYLDDNAAFEAFKAGAYDFRAEGDAKKWATQYRGHLFDRQQIIKTARANDVATDTFWLALNNEKPLFSDHRVRKALGLLLNFEWMNHALFYHAYKRSSSYFQNTEYAATGAPDSREMVILAPFKGQIPDESFTSACPPVISDPSGYDRKKLLQALDLLQQAGWQLKNQRLVNTISRKPFTFELLLNDSSGNSLKWILPFQYNLQRVGIQLQISKVDSSQFLQRRRKGDYDMVTTVYYAQPSPDPTLRLFWASAYINSTWNAPRVRNAQVDSLIAKIQAHQGDKEALLPLGRALDRLLLCSFYMIPLWYSAEDNYAWWNKFSRPAIAPLWSSGTDTWWYDAVKAAQLPAQRR